MFKKIVAWCVMLPLLFIAGCHHKKESPYNRGNDQISYERFLSEHIFAACMNAQHPFATYSLATLLKKPANDDPRYKVKFINGACKGRTVWTTKVILRTAPVGTGELPRGTVLLRNYWNPTEKFDQEKTDRWNIGVVTSNARVDQGIVDLEFPRDRNDFNPAREGIYLHNVRYILKPKAQDIRTFLH